MIMIRVAFTLLALVASAAVDVRSAIAEIYRPWCVQYGSSSGDGGPGHRRLLRPESLVFGIRRRPTGSGQSRQAVIAFTIAAGRSKAGKPDGQDGFVTSIYGCLRA